jgi:hypothetical protein
MNLEGEFAEDESAAMIKAVQASKAPGESHMTSTKAHAEGTVKVSGTSILIDLLIFCLDVDGHCVMPGSAASFHGHWTFMYRTQTPLQE